MYVDDGTKRNSPISPLTSLEKEMEVLRVSSGDLSVLESTNPLKGILLEYVTENICLLAPRFKAFSATGVYLEVKSHPCCVMLFPKLKSITRVHSKGLRVKEFNPFIVILHL